MPGYSGTPLVKKLGIKPGARVWVKNRVSGYEKLVAPLPEGVKILSRAGKELDVVHFFTKQATELFRELPRMMERIAADGAIWVSWPKRASRVATDVTEDVVREAALPLGLVDVKVCAVDEVWSGLKLVIRKELRADR